MFEKETGSSPASKLFHITSLGERVGLAQVCSYTDECLVVQVDATALIQQWSVFKGDAPVKMVGGQRLAAKVFELDEVKADLFKALMAAHCTNQVCLNGIQFYRRPDEARTSMKISKGQLVLAPIAPMANISCRAGVNSISLGKHMAADAHHEFFVAAPGKPPIELADPTNFPADSTVAAFWWIGTTDQLKDANMEVSYITKKDIEVPILTNITDLMPNVKLLKYRAKAAVVQLRGAKVLSGSASGNKDEEPPKRARKSN